MTASTRSIERERSNSAPAPRRARLAQRRQCRRLSRQAAVYRIRFGSAIPSPEISSYLMSRNTRSDTYIKAGSDSSYDSDECSRRYAEPHLEGYCCMGRINIKKAAMIAGIFSVTQLVLNFCLFLTGCGITMVDIWLAILPLVSGTLAMSFLIFALLRHSPTSLKPYIIYHMMTLIGFFLAFILYILVLFHQSHVIFLLRETFSKYSSLAASLENMRIADYQTRLFFGFYLIANLSVSVFCLHIAIGLYLSIDNFLRYLSAECTEIL